MRHSGISPAENMFSDNALANIAKGGAALGIDHILINGSGCYGVLFSEEKQRHRFEP